MSTLVVVTGMSAWSTLILRFKRVQNLLATWEHRRKVRSELLALTDLQLSDVGLSRAEVINIADRPFWRP